jgi:hypothetical protein
VRVTIVNFAGIGHIEYPQIEFCGSTDVGCIPADSSRRICGYMVFTTQKEKKI